MSADRTALSFAPAAPPARTAAAPTAWIAALVVALSGSACGSGTSAEDAADATDGRRDTSGSADTTPRPEVDAEPAPDDASDAQPPEDGSPDVPDAHGGPDATPDDDVATDADAADVRDTSVDDADEDADVVDAGDADAGDTAEDGTDVGDAGGGLVCSEGAAPCEAFERCGDVAGTGPACVAIRVLVLEESSDTTVVDELIRLGFDVTRGPEYGSWDGVAPALEGHDVLFWQQGASWTRTMDAEVQATVANWVAAGGGLVRTEWGIYNYTAFSGPADAILPIESTDNLFTAGATWTRVRDDHPIGATLTPPFTWSNRGFTYFTPAVDAEVVWISDEDVPLVTTTRAFGGPVVHLNHDLHYTSIGLVPDEVTLFVDAVRWAGVNAW